MHPPAEMVLPGPISSLAAGSRRWTAQKIVSVVARSPKDSYELNPVARITPEQKNLCSDACWQRGASRGGARNVLGKLEHKSWD